MALNKGIWDPKLRGTNIKGTNLKSLSSGFHGIYWQNSHTAWGQGLGFGAEGSMGYVGRILPEIT